MGNNSFGVFALRHPFITMFMFGAACDAVVKIVRGYPTTETTTRTWTTDEDGNKDALVSEKTTVEPEVGTDNSVEEA